MINETKKRRNKMTGIECLREEMTNRGCTKTQIESKTVAIVLDILTNSGDKYTSMVEKEGEETKTLSELRHKKEQLEHDVERLRMEIKRVERAYDEIAKKAAIDQKYIEKFTATLKECETESGRDAMRRAQIFINSVTLKTEYDNYAFITALGEILSDGSFGAIEKFKKIEPQATIPEKYTYCI